jgi:ketosteroid isomerase-like protein
MDDLAARLDRLEAYEQIRQLAARYGAGLDARDIPAVVDLYVDDGRPVWFGHHPDGVAGGEALRTAYRGSQSRYSQSQHFMCNHVIDLDDADHAHGTVHALVYQELDEHWTIMAMQYWDRYERVDGRWLISERRPHSWYVTEWNQAPTGPLKSRPPGSEPAKASLPDAFPSWRPFWDSIAADPPNRNRPVSPRTW